MLIILGSLTMRPELVEEVKPILANIRAATLMEAGCIGYDGHIALDNPAKFVFIERWETEAAFQAHLQQPHVQAWRDVAPKYLVARDVDIIHVDRLEKLPPMPVSGSQA